MHVSPRWQKILRDLYENKVRTMLVILAIAIGIVSFGSMFITQEVLLKDMSVQYRAISPSTLTIMLSPFDNSLVKWAKTQPEVVEAQGRTVNSLKLVAPHKTYNLDLYTYWDISSLSLDKVKLEQGSWPSRNEIALERTVANLLHYELGDKVIVELSNGEQRQLIYTARVHDLTAIPATLFPQLTAYVTAQTLVDLDLPADYNQLVLLTSDNLPTKAQLEDYAELIKPKIISRKVSYLGAQIREPGKHWGEDNSKAFTTILNVVGTFSLILSAFLVINTINAILTQQRRQVGVMKAIGAVDNQIIQLYLVMVAIYGVLGLIVAVPGSLGLSYAFTFAVTRFLNLNIINFHLPFPIFIMEVLAAIGVPLLAGLVPILSGSRLPVVQALTNFSANQKTKTNLIINVISKIRGLPRPVLLSLRNTFQKQGRLWLTITTLTVAGTLFISVVNVRSSLMSELYNILSMFSYDADFGLDRDYDASTIKSKLLSFPGVTNVETRTSIGGQLIKEDSSKGEFINFIGLPYDSSMVNPTMLSGRWLNKDDRNAIVVSSPLEKDNPSLTTGRVINVEIHNKNYQFEIVGVVSMVGDKLAFTNFDYLSEVKEKPNVTSSVLINVDPETKANLGKFSDDLRAYLKQNDINVTQFVTIDTIISTNQGQFNFLVGFLLATAVMVACVGGLGLTGTMSLNVMERTREIGVLRSIGATNQALRQLVTIEGIIIGLTSWCIAIPLSMPGSWAFNYALGQAFFQRPMATTVNPIGSIFWLVLILTISILASIVPARRASRMSIRETLSYE